MDNWEVLDAITAAIDHVRSAADDLKDVTSCDDILLALRGITSQLEGRERTLHAFVEAMDDAEQDMLIGEYYRGLI